MDRKMGKLERFGRLRLVMQAASKVKRNIYYVLSLSEIISKWNQLLAKNLLPRLRVPTSECSFLSLEQ